MPTNNLAFYALSILGDLIKDIIYFPLWWYSKGLLKLLRALKNILSDKQKSLAFFVWTKNIFTPMYGQYDIAGFLISFFVRLFQIIFRGIAMMFWLAMAMLVIVFWLLLPFGVFYMIIVQVS